MRFRRRVYSAPGVPTLEMRLGKSMPDRSPVLSGGRRRQAIVGMVMSVIVNLASVGLGADSELWRERAACRGYATDVFFPGIDHPDVQRALAVCHGCEVRTQCLDYAVGTRQPFGVWGGMTEDQRRDLRGARHRC